MAKVCPTCGRDPDDHLEPNLWTGKPVCRLALLSDGSWVHVSRIEEGGNLFDQIKSGRLKIIERLDKT